MTTRQLINILFGCISLLLISLPISCTQSKANTEEKSAYLNKTLPAFSLQDYHGDAYALEDFKGKYIIIHVATTWCPFCNAEASTLEQLYEDYQDKGVEVLIIDVKEDKELVKKLLIDRFDLSFPVLMDTDGKVAASFAPEDVLPDLSRDEVMLASNLLIDPEGKIRFFSLLDTNNFDAQLVELKSVLDALL